MIDLHIHTTISDGSLTPAEIVDEAQKLGLKVIAITDHESVDGVAEAMKVAEATDLKIIPGVEIEAFINRGQEKTIVHILGYNINWKDSGLIDILNKMTANRTNVTKKMVELLKNEGFNIEWDEVAAIAENRQWIGINHILECMLKKGYFTSRKQAMKGYLQYFIYGKKAYVPFSAATVQRAINIIKNAGGIPILAHPGIYNKDYLIPKLIKYGIEGIEVYYPGHTSEKVKKYEELVQKYGLIATGGSDYHGIYHEWEKGLGEIEIPEHIVNRIMTSFGIKSIG
ncbi:PHP domain-containing protein [Thermoanaerobacter siderophilus]|uniref:Putative metal-dependent phosphoesterase, PHP family n=1 Tax=Thermoanaerobacter siderophilus SR4 TaxID=880478 RepID=I9ABK4_9THEO|nr:PHP domain-containing protein [Thermoanaerobacter siderophilus]EIV99381.1 putative metal-dependent phosphoesterase, PHP family [Thermoanaerobacter siderophilus SR4]